MTDKVIFFVQNLQNTVYPKPLDLGSWNVERMFTPPTMCCASRVTRQVSSVTCHVWSVNIFFEYFFLGGGDKVVKLVKGGSVINGPTPSSLLNPMTVSVGQSNLKKGFQSCPSFRPESLMVGWLFLQVIVVLAVSTGNNRPHSFRLP